MTRLSHSLVLVLLATAVAACSLFAGPDVNVRGGWAWPTAAPLPPGAIPVPLDVAAIPEQIVPNAVYDACPAALLGPVIPEYRADAVPPIRYHQQDREVHVRWPVGFSARLAPDLEIIAPDGKIVARAGEESISLGGGYLQGDDVFSVCLGEYAPKRVGASS